MHKVTSFYNSYRDLINDSVGHFSDNTPTQGFSLAKQFIDLLNAHDHFTCLVPTHILSY